MTDASLVCGDFNEILYSNEKWRGNSRCNDNMLEFRGVVDDYNLDDLGFLELKYIWSDNRKGETCICERLDQFLGNPLWKQCYPNTSVTHGTAVYSDHIPIWLTLDKPF